MQEHFYQPVIAFAVRLVSDGQVYPCTFVDYALIMAKRVEAVFAVVRAESACAEAAERHVGRGEVNDGIVHAATAEAERRRKTFYALAV